MGFTEFYWFLSGLLGFIEFYFVFTESKWFFFTEIYWVLLGFDLGRLGVLKSGRVRDKGASRP